jgi:hypothetical protein
LKCQSCECHRVTRSVSAWVTCGKKTPRSEVVFLSQVVILYTVIIVSIYNLTVQEYFHILVFNVLLKRSKILAFVSSFSVVKKWTLFSFRNFGNTLFVNSVPRSVFKRIGCRPSLKMTSEASFKFFPVLSFNGTTHGLTRHPEISGSYTI